MTSTDVGSSLDLRNGNTTAEPVEELCAKSVPVSTLNYLPMSFVLIVLRTSQ